MPDFAVRVRGAKGRSWRSPRRLVAVYLGLWVFALVVFLLMAPTDAMGYNGRIWLYSFYSTGCSCPSPPL